MREPSCGDGSLSWLPSWLKFSVWILILLFNLLWGLGLNMYEFGMNLIGLGALVNKTKYRYLHAMQPNLAYEEKIPISLVNAIGAYHAYKAHGQIDGFCGAPYADVEEYLGPPFDRNFIYRKSPEEQRQLRGEV